MHNTCSYDKNYELVALTAEYGLVQHEKNVKKSLVKI
jgi:hypothetical protein